MKNVKSLLLYSLVFCTISITAQSPWYASQYYSSNEGYNTGYYDDHDRGHNLAYALNLDRHQAKSLKRINRKFDRQVDDILWSRAPRHVKKRRISKARIQKEDKIARLLSRRQYNKYLRLTNQNNRQSRNRDRTRGGRNSCS